MLRFRSTWSASVVCMFSLYVVLLVFVFFFFLFLMIRRPPRSTQSRSSAASDVYKRQGHDPAKGPSASFTLVTLNAGSNGSQMEGLAINQLTVNAPDVIVRGIRNTVYFTTNSSADGLLVSCLLYTSPSPRDRTRSRMPSSA